MIENQEIPEAKSIPINPTPNPVTVYGAGDAMDDFPVLKAFQQYVDSEQAKAHKRLMSVCFFFTMLIVVIIGVFIFVVMNMRSDMNMRANNGAADATVKSLAENNAALQRQLMEQTVRMNEQLMQQLAAKQSTPSHSPVVVVGDNKAKPDTSATDARERDLAAREAALKERERQEAERELEEREKALKEREAKLAAETEAKKAKKAVEDEEAKRARAILEHRRKLYPEYFDEDGNELKAPRKKKVEKPEFDARDLEIARLRHEAEMAKLKAELELLKKEKEADKADDDFADLDAALEGSGIYGDKKKGTAEPLPDVLDIDIGGGSDFTIPLD